MTTILLKYLSWEDVKEIVAAADSFLTGAIRDGVSFPNEEAYYNAVLGKLREQKGVKPPCAIRCAYLISVAEEVTGHRMDDTRSDANALVRKFVAYRLDEEGYGRSETGKAMKKDHSTVTNLYQKMNDILSLPKLYSREVALYREFERRLGGPAK
jgi:hypothetical protein